MTPNINPEFIIDLKLYTLLAFSVTTWTLIFFKLWQFFRIRRNNERFESAFWRLPHLKQIKILAPEATEGPQARLAFTGLAWLNEYQQTEEKTIKHCGDAAELLEQTLRVSVQQEQHAMESGLSVLASIGSTAPFVGLFGTVIGIMNAMHKITESGSSSLDVVAGPIGDALVATAIGIAVAVPAVLAYNFFLRSLKVQRMQLENFVIRFLTVALYTKNEQA